jgi:hypothetical protein
MPFENFQWSEGRLELKDGDPKPELRELDARNFTLLRSFCYRVMRGDPEHETVYVVPGADAGLDPETRIKKTTEEPPHRAVVPPSIGGKTDLASVPPFLWWLIASYGNHTRAALLHDALYTDPGVTPPVARKTADRLFLTALREPDQKTGAFRHWLMWAAVSLFGNMGWRLGGLCALHVLAVWGLTIGAVVWEWGPALGVSRPWWQVVLGALVVVPLFLTVLGTSWRAGVDLTGGWLSPMALLLVVIVVPLSLLDSAFDLWSPSTLLVAAGLLTAIGLIWGLAVDPTLRMWLWPTAMIGLPIAMLPVLLIFLSIGLVLCIDFGAAVAAARRKDQYGRPRPFELPKVKPSRVTF